MYLGTLIVPRLTKPGWFNAHMVLTERSCRDVGYDNCNMMYALKYKVALHAKIFGRKKIIRASRFVVSTLRPMQRTSMDTIGPLLQLTNCLYRSQTRSSDMDPTVARKHGVCIIGWECAMEAHVSALCIVRILYRSGTGFGYTIHLNVLNLTLTHLNLCH